MQKPCTLCVGCGRCTTYNRDINVLTKGGLSQKLTTFPCDVLDKVYEAKDMLVSVDIGTTTVAMTLRRLRDGELIEIYTALNPQRAYGSDVLSRMEREEARLEMKEAIEAVICQGIESFCGYSIKGVVVTGNTTMLYLLQGLQTRELSAAPFEATYLEQAWIEIGGYQTLVMPGISAFVGADVLAGMFALSVNAQKEKGQVAGSLDNALLLDLGTNGEMVYGAEEGLIATATPAAPAYEGGGFGEQIYGADYVALLASLLEHGYMDETGLLMDPYFEDGIVIAGQRIGQQDIRRLQLAKAATAAGLLILTKGKVPEKVYLAGGFGYYLDGFKAEEIGLLPKGFGSRSVAVGNLALEGAFLYGQSQFAGVIDGKEAHQIIHALKQQTKVVNLAMQPEFEKVYIENMNFPVSNTDRIDY